MEISNIHEAESQLFRLIDHAMNGEDVIIAKAGRPMVRLVPILADHSPRIGGQWKGRVRIAEDFDDCPKTWPSPSGSSRHDAFTRHARLPLVACRPATHLRGDFDGPYGQEETP